MTDEIEGASPAPNARAPGAVGVALFMCQRADGSFGVELKTESDQAGVEPMLDPHDICHAVALYVQHEFLTIVPQAAMWMIALAKANKAEAALAAQRAAAGSVFVDINGAAMLPANDAGADAAQAVAAFAEAAGMGLDAPLETGEGDARPFVARPLEYGDPLERG